MEMTMSITDYDQTLFAQACDKIINKERIREGIGTLSEKTVHAVLKNFYEPDPAHQEIPVGTFVADILRDNEIIEIQTRNMNVMRRKLDYFLDQYPVTIVYPIVHTKWLYWIDEETGEVSAKRKSPKTGTPYDAFYELYKIKQYLNRPGLQLCIPMIDVEEYRLLNGWSLDRKKGSTRYDRIPTALVDEYFIGSLQEYDCLIPDQLPAEFSVKDFAKASRLAPRYAQTAIQVLKYIGKIRQIGTEGRAYLYSLTDS